MLLSMATLAEYERRSVVVQLTEMVEHERKIATTAALAPSACRADPATPDPLQRMATEDAATITALLAPGPRLRRVLEAPSSHDGDVRATWCAADAGGSSHDYVFGGAPNSRAAQSGQRTTASTGSSSSASSTVR
jgi:hypothetical protein